MCPNERRAAGGRGGQGEGTTAGTHRTSTKKVRGVPSEKAGKSRTRTPALKSTHSAVWANWGGSWPTKCCSLQFRFQHARLRAPLTPPFYLKANIYTRGTAHRALRGVPALAGGGNDVQLCHRLCTVTHTTVTVIGCDERMTAACPSPLSEHQRFAFAQRFAQATNAHNTESEGQVPRARNGYYDPPNDVFLTGRRRDFAWAGAKFVEAVRT